MLLLGSLDTQKLTMHGVTHLIRVVECGTIHPCALQFHPDSQVHLYVEGVKTAKIPVI